MSIYLSLIQPSSGWREKLFRAQGKGRKCVKCFRCNFNACIFLLSFHQFFFWTKVENRKHQTVICHSAAPFFLAKTVSGLFCYCCSGLFQENRMRVSSHCNQPSVNCIMNLITSIVLSTGIYISAYFVFSEDTSTLTSYTRTIFTWSFLCFVHSICISFWVYLRWMRFCCVYFFSL